MSVAFQPEAEGDGDSGSPSGALGRAPRKRGRPLEMTPTQVLDRIRRLSAAGDGLYRIHHTHSDLYARARRQFGSWAAAVSAAGVDYVGAVTSARQRAGETRRARRRNRTRDR